MTNPDARHAKKRVKEKTSFFFVDPRHQMEELRSGYAIYPNLLLFLVLIFCPPFQTSLSCVSKGDHPRSKREKRETKYEMTYPPPPTFSPQLLEKRIAPSFQGESRAIKMLMPSTLRPPQHSHKGKKKEIWQVDFSFLPIGVTQHL
jgi:hypothetical protein